MKIEKSSINLNLLFGSAIVALQLILVGCGTDEREVAKLRTEVEMLRSEMHHYSPLLLLDVDEETANQSDLEKLNLQMRAEIVALKTEVVKINQEINAYRGALKENAGVFKKSAEAHKLTQSRLKRYKELVAAKIDSLEQRLEKNSKDDSTFRSEGVEWWEQNRTIEFDIHNLEYGLVERQFVPMLKVEADLTANRKSSPKRMTVKLKVEIRNRKETIAEKEFETVLLDGKGRIESEILVHRHRLDEKNLNLRWSILSWQSTHLGTLGVVNLKSNKK